jgi:hypothetical protein
MHPELGNDRSRRARQCMWCPIRRSRALGHRAALHAQATRRHGQSGVRWLDEQNSMFDAIYGMPRCGQQQCSIVGRDLAWRFGLPAAVQFPITQPRPRLDRARLPVGLTSR